VKRRRRARIQIMEGFKYDHFTWEMSNPEGWVARVWLDGRHGSVIHRTWHTSYGDALQAALVAAEALERGLPVEQPHHNPHNLRSAR
jgi:hypothetical protein